MEKMSTPDWRTLTPGKPDSDLYTEQAGHNDDDLTWWDGTRRKSDSYTSSELVLSPERCSALSAHRSHC
jgi:hypothetical protein